MPRKGRRESGTMFYHVIVKGINNEKIYHQQREKVYFKKKILKYLKKYDVELYAYCIMSNHAHLIIKAELPVLSAFMAVVLAEYAVYYNFKHRRNGHVFQNRFVSECIETEAYYWNCLRYIHMNPVKANMVKEPIRYRYSSLVEYKMDTPCMIHANALIRYKDNFNDYKQFETFHKERHLEIFADVREEVMSQKKEAATLIAEQVFEEHPLQLFIQVFEEKEVKKVYISRLVKILKISKKEAEKICNAILNDIQNR